MSDGRIATLRWAKIDNRPRLHLWLGQRAACGIDVFKTLTSDWDDEAYCPKCFLYARGWLDRHDTGDRPQMGEPNPTGYGTRLEVPA